MEAGNDESLTTHFKRPSWQLLSLTSFALFSLFMIAMQFVRWNVDHSVASINKQFDVLSSSMESQISKLEAQISNLDSTMNQVDVKVNNVDSTIAVAESESVRVKDDVVEVRLKVSEISSGLDDTSGKVDSLKTVLNVAFKDNPDIQILLNDDRLSELLPMEFFEGEPNRGAALPGLAEDLHVTQSVDKTQPAEDTIANQCQDHALPVSTCYERYLKKYDSQR